MIETPSGQFVEKTIGWYSRVVSTRQNTGSSVGALLWQVSGSRSLKNLIETVVFPGTTRLDFALSTSCEGV